MNENTVATLVVDAAYRVHTHFGPGLLESAYQAMLAHELRKRGLGVACEQPIPLVYDGLTLDVGYKADMVIEALVIVELKAVEQTAPVHKRQLLTYLKLADKRLGLQIHFGAALIKDGGHRVANGL